MSIINPSVMMSNQRIVIESIINSPITMSKYIHYTDSNIYPLISYNDPNICCILNNILFSNSCNGLTITPLGPSGKIGVPYIIKSSDGLDLVVKVSKLGKLFSDYKTNPPTSLSSITNSELELNQCINKVPLSHIRYLASDEFTNETLIAYVLNILTFKYNLPPLFVKHYQGAICSNTDLYGLNIMENCDLGSLDKLPNHPDFLKYLDEYNIVDNNLDLLAFLVNSDTIFQILSQITCSLHMLQNYLGFISGDLKAGNVFVKSDPINTNYMGIKLNSPFTCKIADYGKSSCMYPLHDGTYLRFYNDSSLADLYLSLHPFSPNIELIENDYYYTVDYTFSAQVHTRTMHMGIPFYKSFDLYTVLVSMLTHPAFFYMFFSNTTLKQIFWDSIWYNSYESEEAINRIRQHVVKGTGRSINDAISILLGLKLKCKAVNIVLGKTLTYQS